MDTAEREEYAEACALPRMGETDNTNAVPDEQKLLERILSRDNLNRAYKRVKANKGAGGIDGMQVEELLPYLKDHREEFLESLRRGVYKPQPVRRVIIPKENGKTRKLGIPTVRDRLVQQAVCQILTPVFEPIFSDNSFGFRPKRSAHDALHRVKEYADEGYHFVVDIDLQSYFDTVNQSKLIQLLSRHVKDGRVVSLIHKFLRAGAMERGAFESSPTGVPQGGPLSPLLGNLMLNELDHELARRGHRFVRYADDLLILCKSKRAAERTMEHIVPFIKGKLFLTVNPEKSQVAHLNGVKYLGYGFRIVRGECRFRAHAKSVTKLKQNLKAITRRSNAMSIDSRRERLNQVIRGWVNYFKLAEMKTLLEKLDEWLRRRMRMVTWKRLKRIRSRFEFLKRCSSITEKQAWQWANTRKGYWRIAGSPILSIVMSKEHFQKNGYLCLSGYYQTVRV